MYGKDPQLYTVSACYYLSVMFMCEEKHQLSLSTAITGYKGNCDLK